MHTKRTLLGIAVLAVCFTLAPGVRGDYVELKDGTVIEGTVLKTKDGYWVKGKDGESRQVTTGEVKSTGKGSKPTTVKPAPAPTAKGKPAPAAPADSSAASAGKTSKVLDYSSTERRANAVDIPLAAVTIWQEFIDSDPPADQLADAKTELAKWKKMADEGAERIKGKWVQGDERKQIVEKAQGLYKEATQMMAGNQTLQALDKLKESVSVYPNSFHANFEIAFLLLIQHNGKEAEKYLLAAQKIKPNTPEVMANLALIEIIDRKQHVKGIEMLHKAAQQGDKKDIVQDFICAVMSAPPAAQKNKKVIDAAGAARLLAAKHGVPAQANQFIIVALSKDEREGGGKQDPATIGLSSGSGFIIDKTGLILTNRHVVEHGKSFLVYINGKKQRSAEVVVIDDEQDLALIRVKKDAGEDLPIVRLSPSDTPGDGAACTVMGYPLIDRLGAAIKVTRGVVSSAATKFEAGPDVVIDAKVNPGNSGGPILDKYGNVMAIVSMKTIASAMEDTYGLGISAGRIRKFLTKNKVEVTKGETTKMLDTEEIATVVKPAAVCILATH